MVSFENTSKSESAPESSYDDEKKRKLKLIRGIYCVTAGVLQTSPELWGGESSDDLKTQKEKNGWLRTVIAKSKEAYKNTDGVEDIIVDDLDTVLSPEKSI